MTVNRFLLLVILVFSFQLARPAWFSNIPVQISQPDGKIIDCFSSGDEFFNWLHDEQGYTIIQAADGYYYYGYVSGDIVKPSTWRVSEVDPSSVGLVKWAKISLPEYQKRKQALSIPDSKSVQTPHTGIINNLVIFIRFSDDIEFVDSRSTFDLRFNSVTGISLKSYYNEVSYTTLAINSTYYPNCSVNTNLSYQDSHPRSYFLPYNATTNPNGYIDLNDRTIREHALLRDAINWINIHSPVPTGLLIDSDNDGYVDNICFIVRGSSSGWSSLLWAHSWSLFTYDVSINGKTVSKYTFHPETQSAANTLCHEMFHTMGAPDLYHYVNTSLQPVQAWDLMDQGFGHMGAYMKWQYSNHTWIDDIPLITTSGTYTLNPLSSPEGNCYKVLSPNTSSEYFVLEYRKKSGAYEINLPATGLLVYRINPIIFGNSTGPPDEVYIYRPGGTVTLNGDPSIANYSAQTGRNTLRDTTSPSGFLSDGLPGGLLISDISQAGDGISFHIDICNTAPPISVSAVATGIDQVNISWNKNGNADNVMVAYGIAPGNWYPKMEVSYQAGDTIPGGGIVIYTGPASGYSHTGLTPSTTYYYSLWSISQGLIYSKNKSCQVNTFCTGAILPYEQHFNTSLIPDCWEEEDDEPSDASWIVCSTNQAGGSAFELSYFGWFTMGNYSRLVLLPFNTVGITKLNMSFRFKMTSMLPGAKIRLQTSSDKINWTNEAWFVNTINYPGDTVRYISTTISTNLDKPITYIAFECEGNLYSVGTLYFDDIGISIAECNFYTVHTSAEPTDGGHVSGTGNYYPGETATVSATSNSTYNFLYWESNGSILSYQPAFSFEVDSNSTLDAVFSKTKVSVRALPDTITSGTTSGSGVYNLLQPVDIVAIPAEGHVFSNWTENGAVIATTPGYSFSATKNRSIIANFTTQYLHLHLLAYPVVGGTYTGSGSFAYGSVVTVTAIPSEGYQFSGWYDDNTLVSSLSQYSFTIHSDEILQAKFICPTCNVNLVSDPAEAGVVEGGGIYTMGTEVVINATANDGWAFSSWKEAGIELSKQNQYSFIVDQNHDMVAEFLKKFMIQTVVYPENSGMVVGGGPFIQGQVCSLIAVPDNGYRFKYWEENGDSINASNVIEFNVNSDRRLRAIFHSVNGQDEIEPFNRLYPNPTSGEIILELESGIDLTNGEIRVMNTLGICVMKQDIKKGDKQILLSLSGLPEGMYYFSLITKGNYFLTQKVLLSQ